MKIKGKKLESSNVMTIVLPRYNGEEDIVFLAKVVLDYSELKRLIKDPVAPDSIQNGKHVPDLKDKGYVSQAKKNYEHRLNFMVLASLSETEGLEWETVDMTQPSTWGNWETELKEAGLPTSEVNYIFDKVWEVNSLDADKMDEARDRFLLMKRG